MGAHKSAYPTQARIRSAVAAAKAAGIRVSGFEIGPDGSIRILSGDEGKSEPAYDRWKRQSAA